MVALGKYLSVHQLIDCGINLNRALGGGGNFRGLSTFHRAREPQGQLYNLNFYWTVAGFNSYIISFSIGQ